MYLKLKLLTIHLQIIQWSWYFLVCINWYVVWVVLLTCVSLNKCDCLKKCLATARFASTFLLQIQWKGFKRKFMELMVKLKVFFFLQRASTSTKPQVLLPFSYFIAIYFFRVILKLNSIKKWHLHTDTQAQTLKGKKNTLNLKAVFELAFVLALRHVHRAVVSENIQQSAFPPSWTSNNAVMTQ